MNKSTKAVKTLEEIVIPAKFIFPKEKANAIDPITKKKAIYASIGHEVIYFPVEEPVELHYDYFSLFIDIKLLSTLYKFDPVRNV